MSRLEPWSVAWERASVRDYIKIWNFAIKKIESFTIALCSYVLLKYFFIFLLKIISKKACQLATNLSCKCYPPLLPAPDLPEHLSAGHWLTAGLCCVGRCYPCDGPWTTESALVSCPVGILSTAQWDPRQTILASFQEAFSCIPNSSRSLPCW